MRFVFSPKPYVMFETLIAIGKWHSSILISI